MEKEVFYQLNSKDKFTEGEFEVLSWAILKEILNIGNKISDLNISILKSKTEGEAESYSAQKEYYLKKHEILKKFHKNLIGIRIKKMEE